MASKFQTLVQQQLHDMGINARSAKGWFQGKIAQLTGVTPNKMMSNTEMHRGLPEIGSMYAYYYDPKLKETLPYYDRFPLTIPIEKYGDGFLGINLHYLPPRYRLILMEKLMDVSTDAVINSTTKLKLTYGFLRSASRYKEFRPCLKRYLYSHVQTKFLLIEPTEWEKAIFMPVERFQKKGKSSVWNDSMRNM